MGDATQSEITNESAQVTLVTQEIKSPHARVRARAFLLHGPRTHPPTHSFLKSSVTSVTRWISLAFRIFKRHSCVTLASLTAWMAVQMRKALDERTNVPCAGLTARVTNGADWRGSGA